MMGVAGGSLGPRPCVDGLHCNAAPMPSGCTAGGFQKWNQVIQTFPLQCVQEPLAKGIRLGTLPWRFQDPQSHVAYVLVELMRENAIAVMDQEAVGVVRWDCFVQLL